MQLLDLSQPHNVKKKLVLCLLRISASIKCKKMVVDHGTIIGYLKKHSKMDVNKAKKLLQRMEQIAKEFVIKIPLSMNSYVTCFFVYLMNAKC